MPFAIDKFKSKKLISLNLLIKLIGDKDFKRNFVSFSLDMSAHNDLKVLFLFVNQNIYCG